jgi:hypothetical protein
LQKSYPGQFVFQAGYQHLNSSRLTPLHFSSSEIASLVTLSHINDRILYLDSKFDQMISQSDTDNHRAERFVEKRREEKRREEKRREEKKRKE